MTPVIPANARFSGRIALVTGASRGIGRAVAVGLAREGAHVIALARTQGALEELDDELMAFGAKSTLVPINVCDKDAATNVGRGIYERFGKLDILVSAAAMLGTLGPVSHTKTTAWDRVIDTNLTANARLIRSLDPLLRASDAGRAVFLSDSVATNPTAYWGAYAASKAGLEMLVKVYAEETRKTNVRVNLVDPGPTRTALRAQAYPGEDATAIKHPDATVPDILALLDMGAERHGERIVITAANTQ